MMHIASNVPADSSAAARMGRLHARTYAQMPQTKLVGVHDAIPKAAEAVAAESDESDRKSERAGGAGLRP